MFSAGGLWSRADWNADGVVDGSDFILWNAHKFNASDQSAPSSIPAVDNKLDVEDHDERKDRIVDLVFAMPW